MMATESPQRHSPPSPSAKRPKGILKNSYRISPERQASDVAAPPLPISPTAILSPYPASPIGDPMSNDNDMTIQNTLQNAGPRRSSSAARPAGSRRQSSHTHSTSNSSQQAQADEHQKLKWDEANLYLTEQEKSATMKIDEPKTPYAKHYDPAEDADEIRMLDADEIMVDELDKVRAAKTGKAKEEEIPGLSLGEPEEAVPVPEEGHRGRERKAVHVQGEGDEKNGGDEKHKKFEELRKKHYEMRDVATLLGHPEEVEALVEKEDKHDDAEMSGTR